MYYRLLVRWTEIKWGLFPRFRSTDWLLKAIKRDKEFVEYFGQRAADGGRLFLFHRRAAESRIGRYRSEIHRRSR